MHSAAKAKAQFAYLHVFEDIKAIVFPERRLAPWSIVLWIVFYLDMVAFEA